jgi:hypothetical protein
MTIIGFTNAHRVADECMYNLLTTNVIRPTFDERKAIQNPKGGLE